MNNYIQKLLDFFYVYADELICNKVTWALTLYLSFYKEGAQSSTTLCSGEPGLPAL